MNRRNFIIGTGATAVGLSALVGSGAFSAAQMSRGAEIDVVNDSQGLLALQAGPEIESDVIRAENGQLTIDFTAGGSAGGVNTNSRYQVGVFDSGYTSSMPGASPTSDTPALDWQNGIGDDHAFAIVNQDTVDHSLGVTYETDEEYEFSGETLFLQFVPVGAGNTGDHNIGVGASNPDGDSFSNVIPAGGEYRAVLLIDTRSVKGENPEDVDLSGSLTVSAGEAPQSQT